MHTDYSISFVSNVLGGWFDVKEKQLPESFLRKRIIIETLDKEGNVIATSQAPESDKNSIMATLFAKYGAELIIRESYPDFFIEDELQTAINLIERKYGSVPTQESVIAIRDLIDKHGLQKIEFANDLAYGSHWNVSSKSPYYKVYLTFDESLDFISEREGFYYAMDKQGNRVYDFVDRPTKSQIKYQQNKNENQVVFLSFSDWKLHNI